MSDDAYIQPSERGRLRKTDIRIWLALRLLYWYQRSLRQGSRTITIRVSEVKREAGK